MRRHISTNDLAYTGGIIDGEGSIGIKRAKSGQGKKTEEEIAIDEANRILMSTYNKKGK